MAYSSEQEQIEAIRRWWSENGRSVIAGVVIALAGVFGWQGWQSYQEGRASAAAERYEGLMAAAAAGEGDVARDDLRALRESYADNAYYMLASFRLAATYVAEDDLQAAVQVLQTAVDTADQPALLPLARIRLAQALSAAGRGEAALEALQPIESGPYLARAAELRGDILLANGNRDAALQAYRAAVDAGPIAPRRQLIDSKLADLGASADAAAT